MKAQEKNAIKETLEMHEEHEIIYELAKSKAQKTREVCNRIINQYLEIQPQGGMETEN